LRLETKKINIVNRIKVFYEELAEIKGDMIFHYQNFAPKRRLNEIVNIIIKKKYHSIIDIGCGDGIFLNEIEKKFQNSNTLFVGVDISEKRLIRTRKRTSAKLCNADAENLPFKEQKFEMTICSEVLEHVISPENVIKELSRITKYGRDLIISVPVACWYRTFLAILFKRRIWYVDEVEHLREYSYFNIDRFVEITYLFNNLRSIGLEIKAVKGAFFFVIGPIEKLLNKICKVGLNFLKIFYLIDKILGEIPFIKYFGRYLIIECEKVDIKN